MQVTFWGTRGSIPSPGPQTARYGGNTSCVEVRLDEGTRLIFDAGTGLRVLGSELMAQSDPVEAHLFLTHMHWDHIQGLPFFTPAFFNNTELTIQGPEEQHLSLEQILCDQMRRPYYPIPMHTMTAKIDFNPLTEGSVHHIGGATIEVCFLNHPGTTLGYRLSAEDKVLVYATDNEPFGADPTSQHLVRPSRLLDLAHEADLLIQDAQYTPDEYPQRLGWGHSTYIDALMLARQAKVKRLALYHHDPSHDDRQIDGIVAKSAAWIQTENAAFTFFAAVEGETLTL